MGKRRMIRERSGPDLLLRARVGDNPRMPMKDLDCYHARSVEVPRILTQMTLQ